jgi:putative DNA primase/helicase
MAFNEAFDAWTTTKTLAGVGFVFTEDDTFVGIDLDDINKWNGSSDIVNKFNSYCEISPSKKGLHIICEGYLPGEVHSRKVGSHKDGEICVWDSGRFMTVTLNPLDINNEHFLTISKNQEAIDWLYESLDDKGLVSKILRSEYSKKFADLWAGSWNKYYPSQSEADLALMRILANNHCPMHQIDRIFKKTKLYRQKYNEKRGTSTYGMQTLEKALSEN